ncbi:MAG: holo-[acyl-carrier-protein] synthase [Fimbriimonadales bacterium]|nr:MAG: holo-[acyl-carrier-protein] synthase [Fimbriimonadales bacterium]
MIRGIGIDVISIDRIRRAMQNPRFLPRILTPKEIEQARDVAYVAGRWAGKEAIAKAVSTRLSWQDVEILADDTGAPRVHWRNGSNAAVWLSISHDKSVAVACAIWEE